jgi:Asp-tRNA(Asn)/Glu-tRNA(Gln) amidotransferase A subunit family amidase
VPTSNACNDTSSGRHEHAITVIDLAGSTIDQIQAAFTAGTLTAEALTQACLERIARWNPAYNAVILLNERALDAAREIDQQRRNGTVMGPLAGIPVVVKDTMDMVGFPTTAGWRLLYGKTGGIDLMPATDAPVIARLRAAGAIILGKTNVPILSHSGTHANDSWAGPTYNATGRGFVPGGSSAGTATAVAAGMAVVGLGEETGGSIQNPASAQALVGIKPTFGLVPTTGVMPLSSLRDVVGPLARTVRDAALTLDVISGYTAADFKTAACIGHRPAGGYAANWRSGALKGSRIGTYGPGWRAQPLSIEAAQLYERVQTELSTLGAQLVQDPFAQSGFADLCRPTPSHSEDDNRGLESLPFDLHQYLTHLGPDAALKTFQDFVHATADEDAFGPNGKLHFMHGVPGFAECLAAPTVAPNQAEFIALREHYLALFDQVFHRHRLDALIFPQMRSELPGLIDARPIAETTVSEINIAGLPGITVPAGYYASGAPFCLVFVGRPWSEARLLQFAYDYEQATRHRRSPVLESGST